MLLGNNETRIEFNFFAFMCENCQIVLSFIRKPNPYNLIDLF